ncbi:retinol dehydrogenase 11-like [Neocloeon triangulifer]|uniref:retinol dehydrogenase 11-like n=1 Tax=Neocloeon triangulifer TaxID=2078957 RepID=UPI00286F95DA|nr:retinol dehydrogenase 11-like [Neocloeon triangulifer]
MGLFGSGKCTSKATLEGKTVLITGANTGIGYETAKDLLKRGARIIMACRNVDRAKSAARELQKEVLGGEIRVVELNLASLKSVKECANDILASEPKIHLLINNAGVMACPYTKTEDGLEMQFQTNHLGHFLLTNLLLPKIKESAPARIINVSALAHRAGRVNFDDLQSTRSYNSVIAYSTSKLCNLLFTLELQERLKNTGVVTYALHPGVVATELGRHTPCGCGWLFQRLGCFIKTPVQGAQTTLHCALDEQLAEQNEFYFSDCKPAHVSARASNKDDAKKLWEVSEELVKSYL